MTAVAYAVRIVEVLAVQLPDLRGFIGWSKRAVVGRRVALLQDLPRGIGIAHAPVRLGGAKVGFGPFGIDLDSRLEGDNSLLIISAIQVMHTQIILFLPRILCAAGDEE